MKWECLGVDGEGIGVLDGIVENLVERIRKVDGDGGEKGDCGR